jgi:hypothetical protein
VAQDAGQLFRCRLSDVLCLFSHVCSQLPFFYIRSPTVTSVSGPRYIKVTVKIQIKIAPNTQKQYKAFKPQKPSSLPLFSLQKILKCSNPSILFSLVFVLPDNFNKLIPRIAG